MPLVSLLPVALQLLRCEIQQDRRPGLLFFSFHFLSFDGQDGWLKLACVFSPHVSPSRGSGTFRSAGGV